jgi:hypothetical protein
MCYNVICILYALLCRQNFILVKSGCYTGEFAGQLAIFTDGAPAPPVTFFAVSKSLCRSIDVTKAHNMTLAGDASFNGGIFLAAAAVDSALKGSVAGERMNTSFGREVRENEMS